jgi:hypothetical protein
LSAFPFLASPATANPALLDENALQTPATGAVVDPLPEIFTVTGSLTGAEALSAGFPWKMKLKVKEEVYDVEVAEDCVFRDLRKKAISGPEFFRMFLGKVITVDFYGINDGDMTRNVAVECRVGGQ